MSNLWSAATLMLFAALTATVCGCDSPPATTVPAAKPTVEATVNKAVEASADKPRPKLRPGAKTVALTRAGDRAFDKTFDDLRFEMEVGAPFRREMLTDAIDALAGQHVRIRGFMLPTAQKRGIKQFVLVRDNQECCFGPGAALFDCILVEMQPSTTAEFSVRPIAVAGTFDIREFVGPDGRHLAIYHLAAESAE